MLEREGGRTGGAGGTGGRESGGGGGGGARPREPDRISLSQKPFQTIWAPPASNLRGGPTAGRGGPG